MFYFLDQYQNYGHIKTIFKLVKLIKMHNINMNQYVIYTHTHIHVHTHTHTHTHTHIYRSHGHPVYGR